MPLCIECNKDRPLSLLHSIITWWGFDIHICSSSCVLKNKGRNLCVWYMSSRRTAASFRVTYHIFPRYVSLAEALYLRPRLHHSKSDIFLGHHSGSLSGHLGTTWCRPDHSPTPLSLFACPLSAWEGADGSRRGRWDWRPVERGVPHHVRLISTHIILTPGCIICT